MKYISVVVGIILIFTPLLALGDSVGNFGEVGFEYSLDETTLSFNLLVGIFYQENKFRHTIFFEEKVYMGLVTKRVKTVECIGYDLGYLNKYKVGVKRVFVKGDINFDLPSRDTTVLEMKIVW